jgi:tetratricopeptide (TPR) repeat protein
VTSSSGPEERNAVPRWRSVWVAAESGELGSSEPALPTLERRADVERLRDEFEQYRTETIAAELLSAAVQMSEPEKAVHALAFLDDAASTTSVEALVESTRGAANKEPAIPPTPEEAVGRARLKAASAKASVRRDPRNAIGWAELGRSYAAQGQLNRAKIAVSVALAVAPGSRYILRCAACLFVASGEADRAHYLIVKAPRTRADPWLAAAELATAAAAGEQSRLVKHARLLLEAGDFEALDVTELASELGTLELSASSKRAKRLFQRALARPTENSLAQVEWASQRLAGLEVSTISLSNTPRAHEARTIHLMGSGNWEAASGEAQAWLADQVFSTRAALAASFVAATGLENWRLSLELAEAALNIHPYDAALLNNAAYPAIELGEYNCARQHLDRAATVNAEEGARICLIATRGLLKYREGERAAGKILYAEAIARAHANPRLRYLEALATLMLAREEMSIDAKEGVRILSVAKRLMPPWPEPATSRWMERIEGMVPAAG